MTISMCLVSGDMCRN